MKILTFEPSLSQIERARKLKESFVLNKNSVMDGNRNLYAFLGEVVVGDFLSERGWSVKNCKDFDLLDPDGCRWDLKTKMTTVKPKSNYRCTVHSYYLQKCDGYIFCRCLKNLSKVFLLGKIRKQDFMEKGELLKVGDVENGMVIDRDVWSLRISELNTFEEYACV